MTGRQRRASLSGWWKYVPLLAVPFLVIFAEAWMNIELLGHHYHANELSTQARQLRSEIETLRDQRHNLERLERIYAEALEFGLTEPDPGQIEIMEPLDTKDTEEVVELADASDGANSQ